MHSGGITSTFLATDEKVGIWWAALVPMAVTKSWRKCLLMNERLLFFNIVSSSIMFVWWLRAPGGRALACNYVV